MPMSGGTRMLRARRKDCNVKPNRRLDRKSSRGMLFENEELRMRTITINAEVEQGQHALKKLRRENEQLRREMWCLRDEYDKMEKLLRKREEGEESDQENSDSDDNATRTDESDEEKRGLRQLAQQEANPDLETEENLQKLSQFGNEANVRTFDGLSVIDEQTEETQTTESAGGYGTLSRGNSANRTFHPPLPLQDEACTLPDAQPYGFDPFGDKPPRKKGLCLYENGAGFPQEWAAGDTYDVRPASPYPYAGSFRPSYQKQFQTLQELPLVPQTPANALGENGWIFPDPEKLPGHDMPGYSVYVDNSFLPEKPPDAGGFGFDLIQNRAGPDVFVTGGFSQVNNQVVPDSVQKIQGAVEGNPQNLIDNVEAEIDKIEISEKSEMDPKMQEMTTLTKPAVSRGEARPATLPQEPRETADSGKLTMDAAVDENDNGVSNHVQQLVTCQNSNGQHVRETTDSAHNNPPTDDMPLSEKPGSKYQTRLMVTLKAPPPVRPEARAPKKVPGPVAPRAFPPHLRCAIRPDYAVVQRFQTFPSPGFQPNARMPANGQCLVSHYAGVRAPGTAGLFGSLPRLPTFVPKTELGLTPSNIPDEFEKDLDVLPDEESPTVPVKQSLAKPVKIPPVPPPRTSSCPKPIIPPPPAGLTALHQRAFRKGKTLHSQDSLDRPSEPTIFNPLLMSQPIATSSPTISLKETKFPNASTENLYSFKCRKPSYNEDSSLEEFSRQRFRLKDDFPRGDVPKLNKSLSSPSFGSFRTPRRKQSEATATSVENILGQKLPEAIGERVERKTSKSRAAQSNASVSSSSGLDSPSKSDGRKRRVSIQFKKKRGEDEGGGKESGDSRGEGTVPGILLAKGKGKGKGEETDATTSDRERTNSVSSRTSSVLGGSSGRRKYSVSSNRTYLNDEKIPWCGCWGNGCV